MKSITRNLTIAITVVLLILTLIFSSTPLSGQNTWEGETYTASLGDNSASIELNEIQTWELQAQAGKFYYFKLRAGSADLDLQIDDENGPWLGRSNYPGGIENLLIPNGGDQTLYARVISVNTAVSYKLTIEEVEPIQGKIGSIDDQITEEHGFSLISVDVTPGNTYNLTLTGQRANIGVVVYDNWERVAESILGDPYPKQLSFIASADKVYLVTAVFGSGTGSYTIDLVEIPSDDDGFFIPLWLLGLGSLGVISIAGGWWYFKRSSKIRMTKTLGDVLDPFLEPNKNLAFQILGVGQSNSDEIDTTPFPSELLEMKILMHPIRLAMMKLLHEEEQFSPAELRNTLNISWGAYANHIKALQENGYVETIEYFDESSVAKAVRILPLGIDSYERFRESLIEFLREDMDDLYPEIDYFK